jgi:hypothetical protein
MSLWTKFESVFLGGVDPDVEQQRQTELDAQIAAQDQNEVTKGVWNGDQLAAATADLAKSDTPDIQGEVDQAFVSGLSDGTKRTPKSISEIIAGIIKFFWNMIPWQLWVFGLIALFLYLGGIEYLKRKLKSA